MATLDEESHRVRCAEKDGNPRDWGTGKKALNLTIVSILAFMTYVPPDSRSPGLFNRKTKQPPSPFESSVIVPGVPLLKASFHESRAPVTSLVVSIFVLGFAFAPLLLSPLSEIYGRRPLYNLSNLVTLAFCVACALAPDVPSFIVFRFVAGSFGAGPMNVGGGSIADLVRPERRGLAMSVFFTGIFLGPSLGYGNAMVHQETRVSIKLG